MVSSSGVSDFSTSAFWRRSKYGRIFSFKRSTCGKGRGIALKASRTRKRSNLERNVKKREPTWLDKPTDLSESA
eukprot:5423618-Pleurochrysis_carterae.AAC.10